MKTKQNIMIGLGILLILTMFSVVSAISYSEDAEGNSFYEADDLFKVPQMSIRDLFILQPSIEPAEPELGMIYFDVETKRLKLYDGTGWYAIALEKVSSVSKKQVVEKVEKKGEVQTCSESIDCGEWGDCINNYQSMTCVTVDESCNKYEDTETRDCISDFELESSAKESHDVGVSEEEAEDEEEETETTEEEEAEDEEEGEEEEAEDEVEEEPEPEEAEEPAEEVPEELFDITFDLEQSSLSKSDKLVIWVTLQNFGKRYVPARLVYTVTDETSTEVYKEFEEIRVYTDESIIKQFDNMVLEEGDYVLSMRVEYAGIIEEFSDEFSVESGIFNAIKRFFSGLF